MMCVGFSESAFSTRLLFCGFRENQTTPEQLEFGFRKKTALDAIVLRIHMQLSVRTAHSTRTHATHHTMHQQRESVSCGFASRAIDLLEALGEGRVQVVELLARDSVPLFGQKRLELVRGLGSSFHSALLHGAEQVLDQIHIRTDLQQHRYISDKQKHHSKRRQHEQETTA